MEIAINKVISNKGDIVMTMTRQDLLAATESAKNKIIEKLVTRYDVQYAADQARDRIMSNMNALHVELMATLRNSNAHHDQTLRKMNDLETRMAGLQQEVRTLQQVMTRLSGSVR